MVPGLSCFLLAVPAGLVHSQVWAGETTAAAPHEAGEFERALEPVDLHVWEIGPGYRAAIVAVRAVEALDPEEVKSLIPENLGISHLTVEIHAVPFEKMRAPSERTS